jgi:Ni,Fe-hydrogenase maturation factor
LRSESISASFRPKRQGRPNQTLHLLPVALTCALLDGYEAVILVDAVSRGGQAGTLYVLEPEPDPVASGSEATGSMVELHDLNPRQVLRMGSAVRRVLLVESLVGRLSRAESGEPSFQVG